MEVNIPFSGQDLDTDDDAGKNVASGVAAVAGFVLLFVTVGVARAVWNWLKETTGADNLEVPLA